MTQPVIIASQHLPEALLGLLAQFGDVRRAGNDNMNDAVVYLTSALEPVSAAMIESFPDSLGLIANLGVGTDNIDLAAAQARSILVSNTPVVTEDTADLAMALLLATCRRLTVSERLLREGDWAGSKAHLGNRVHGKTLGIVGFGAIGQAVARRARGFDMDILYHGPSAKPEAEQALGARYCESLSDLLQQADVVSLHCPLSDASRHLMNAATLAQMKPGAVLVNTGRGPLVDEAALVASLESGHLGGAGLDVFEFEPQVTPALLGFDNVTLLPHIGSATGECRQDIALRGLANIREFLASGNVIDRVGS
ncbi:D-glycerate dehydrogenase [Aestuariicella hydrocarbonica]|uniref:D-glycerate dehydrogenase n=1 Tax=Pseudomaricurvus hydrocarbonicus TaxID=1470433 RepID=A0A9E5T417_9GAMM|nr:D-glycerate dehydrogenase [Aestuariicella hydrocarbonica]NHO67474.1 D-glycerate dehydrogenase [Aestuariicella hydrocarbonica]